MKRLFYIVLLMSATFCSLQVDAQAPSRRRAMEEKEEDTNVLSVRAQSQFTPSVDVPAEMKWKRDIYRIIDLEKEKNTALYYPERPIGDQMNLFSLIFKLALENKIKIYEYNIDGNEMLTDDNIISVKDMLDRFNIYYRRKLVNRRDTVLVVDNSDIPSNEAKSYFVKEVNYFDDRSSTMNSTIEAICPVLHRSDEFTYEMTKYPMFWVRYKDLEPYLTQTSVMISDYNNASNVTVADYFAARMYEGEIYKTTNRLNRTLAQYCPNDSTMKAEQARIEGQLKAFEEGLWGMREETPVKDEAVEKTVDEEIPDEAEKTENSKRVGRDRQGDDEKSEAADDNKVKKETKSKKSSSVSSRAPKSAPRATVRRERR